ncbi:hypothetical protein [Fischerella thermalis]|nr:hypothetical protein [Fischerella thermalis]
MRLRFQSQGEFLNIWDAPRETSGMKRETSRMKRETSGMKRKTSGMKREV